MDEKWIHRYTPETKISSAEWRAAGESRPRRSKIQQWAGKVMASVFWDAHGILFTDYLEKGKTTNSDYYMALLDRLSAEITNTMVKLNDLSFELLPHPPYSPDLASSNHWPLADLKKKAPGKEI